MLLSSFDSTVLSETQTGFPETSLGPRLRGHDRLTVSWESQSGPRYFRKEICPGQVPGVSSRATSASTSPVFGAWRDEGGGGKRGGRRRGEQEELCSREEGALRERQGVMNEVADGEVRSLRVP